MVTNDLSQDQRMHRICSTLSTAGFDVLLVGRLKQNSLPLSTHPFHTKRIKCIFNSGFLFYTEYNLRLFFFLLFQHVDIINSVDLDTLVAGKIASVVTRKQFTFDAHELFTEVPELSGRRFRKWIWSLVQRIFVSGRMDCYTVNEQLATRLADETGKEFGIIYNYPLSFVGGDANKNDANKNVDSPIKLVYQGMLNVGRGLLEVIRAVGSNGNYELHILGRGDIEKQIKELASKHFNIYIHGFVEASKLPAKTKQFDIGLNLLIDTSDNYLYSSANKFFDYIMAGLPVISMNFPEYRKVNDEYNVGILLKDLQQESIVNAIESIRKNYGLYSKNSAKAAQELHWESQEKLLLEIYGSLKDET